MKIAAVLIGVTAWLGFAAPALAGETALSMPARAEQQPAGNPFSSLVGARRERRVDRVRVDRYVLATDNRSVLIQARARTARVSFLCGADDPRLDCQLDPAGPAPEIYLMTVTRGPRGDQIFKNAEGDTLLRIASYGGATIFWPGEDRGLAASKSFGEDETLELAFEDLETARRRANAASAHISALTGAPITFDILTPLPGEGANAAVLADAILRAAVALKSVAADPTGARIVGDRIKSVAFETGLAPGVSLEDGRLLIAYVPDQDIGGRPSSRAIVRFLEDSL